MITVSRFKHSDRGALIKAVVLVAMLFGAFGASNSFAVQPPESSEPAASTAAETSQASQVSINSADAETLAQELDGIGEVKADAIVAWRESNGGFSSVDELTQVKGIGEATLAKNRDRLSL